MKQGSRILRVGYLAMRTSMNDYFVNRQNKSKNALWFRCFNISKAFRELYFARDKASERGHGVC